MKTLLDRRAFLRGTAGALGLGGLLPIAGLLEKMPLRQAGVDPLRAAMMNDGLVVSWGAQGKLAAEQMGRWLGVEIEWFDGNLDLNQQRANMREIAERDWDFVAVQPGSIGTLVESTEELTRRDIPVVDMDTLIAPFPLLQEIGILTFITPDNVQMAESVVQALVDKMGGEGKIAHTWGRQGHTGAQGRAQGFYNVIQRYPNIEVVDDQPGDWNVEMTTEIWEVLLNRHPDLKAGFLHNDDMALAARRVVERHGMQDRVVLGGVDAMIPAIQAVGEGRLLATARNSSPRVHGWAVLAGYYAATMGLEQARLDIPPMIVADGTLITLDVQSDPELVNEPWKIRGYGRNNLDSFIWAEQQLVF
ncbi:MAG: sugar ABC transporter substrate-binding protein [Anaerolineae bacterium]|nr:sugar ABC transporter substrate-binding protein [Anaerolineae bacterium]